MRSRSVFFFLLGSYSAYSQSISKNTVELSVPLIWNNSYATELRSTVPVKETGNALSAGAFIKYARKFGHNFFVEGGLGLFKQQFQIRRACDFDVPGSTLLYASKYSYLCIDYTLGLGYRKTITNSVIEVSSNYHSLQSFKQVYENPSLKQENSETLSIGHIIDISVGLAKNLNNYISVEPTIVIPLINNWKRDEMFLSDTKIAKTSISAGLSIAIKYHFSN